MASIEINPEYGFSLIETELMKLTSKIDTMRGNNQMTEEAAIELLSELKNIANICRNYRPSEEEKINDVNNRTISF